MINRSAPGFNPPINLAKKLKDVLISVCKSSYLLNLKIKLIQIN